MGDGLQITIASISGLAFIALSIFIYLRATGAYAIRNRIFTTIWTVPALLSLVMIAFLSNKGWVSAEHTLRSSMMVLGIGLFGSAPLLRSKVLQWMLQVGPAYRVGYSIVRDIVILAFTVVAAMIAVEFPWNDRFLDLSLFRVLVNLLPVAVVFISFYLIGQRHGAILCPLAIAALLIGLAQYFVGQFKNAAIMPSDIFALNTAVAVSSGYSFIITINQIFCILLTIVSVALLSFMQPLQGKDEAVFPKVFTYSSVRLCTGLLALLALTVSLGSVRFSDDLGFADVYWDSLNVYKDQGFIASFITLVQNADIEAPVGYSEADAQQLEDQYARRYLDGRGSSEARLAAEAQFSELKPTVIAVMSEGFSDLSIYDGLHVGYEGPAFLKSIPDALYTGSVFTSVIGAQTCNSEFEFLTQSSLAFIGPENQPYITHDLSNASCLPRTLADLGYTTTAVHPQPKGNWNRETVYKNMGFDRFLDIESFSEDAPIIHNGIADDETYKKVLDVLDESDSPQFIFDITMQNHGGYATWDLPEEERLDYDLSWLPENVAIETSEYLSLINISDRQLEWFINELRDIDRPVVLVFFGDHQPWMGNPINAASRPGMDSDDPSFFMRTYRTPYLIWANYDVDGSDQVSEHKNIGLYSLQSLLFDAIGAPLSSQQMAILGVSEEVPILNGFAYQTLDGGWRSFDGEAELAAAVRDLEWIQYLNYASRL